MRVTIIADPQIPVPPRRYGGSERIIGALCSGLRAAGHQVRLIAGPGSRDYGELLLHRAPGPSFASRAYRKLLFQMLSLAGAHEADVVHNFARIDYLWALLAVQVPLVVSFMNPIMPGDVEFFAGRRDKLFLVSASDNHRRDAGTASPWRTVYPAIEVERIPFRARPRGDYLAFLGRLTPNKGAREAIAVARGAGLPLKIAGNISKEPGAEEYFETEVRPHLRGSIEWVGEITDAQKGDFLGNARALLFPIQWEEPFGISVAEAFAAGTPVIATRRGATAEQITDGETGLLCHTVDDMIAATTRIDQLDRAACRHSCVSRFSAAAMTARYLELYGQIAGSRPRS